MYKKNKVYNLAQKFFSKVLKWELENFKKNNRKDFKKDEELEMEAYRALRKNNLEIADELFSSKVNIQRITKNEKWNWLHQLLMSIEAPPSRSVKYLIDKGVPVNAIDCYGMTPLHYAMRKYKDYAIVKLLLEAGADPNLPDENGTLIPFRTACGQPFDKKMVDLFLQYGGDPYVEDKYGKKWLEVLNKTLNDLEGWTPVRIYLNEYEAKLKAEGKHLPKPKKKKIIVDKPLHDGKSEIIIKASDNWLDQYKELWNLLVPKQGKALTIQGEVIRICGKLAYEILDNGRINWDNDFEMMCKELSKYLLSCENRLSEEENKKIKSIVSKIKKDTVKEKDFDKLMELCTKWILLNKMPRELKEVPYKR